MVYVTDRRAVLGGSSVAGYDANGRPLTDRPAFVTYSFEQDTSALNVAGNGQAFVDSFKALTDAQRQLAREAFRQWDAASGITFFEVPAGQGDIKLAVFDFDKGGPYNSSQAAAYAGGEQFFISDKIGTGSQQLYLHEIGHNLGLKHSFDGEYTLAPADDNYGNTVMSYTSGGFSGATLGRLDLEAITYLYGAAGSDGRQVASWRWDAATYTLTQTGFDTGEVIRGIGANDVIDARGGDDTINASGGNDRLYGGAGRDTINVTMSARTDTLIDGGSGDDTINITYNAAGTFRVDGGADTDMLWILAWNFAGNRISLADMLANGSQLANVERVGFALPEGRAMTVIGSPVADQIFFGAGNDVGEGGAGDDYLSGGLGDDRIDGGDGNDTLIGGGGRDRLYGGAGDDSLSVTLSGSFDGIVLDGGAGRDTASITLAGAAGRTLALSAIGAVAVETINVTAGAGDDTLVNDLGAVALSLSGGAGDDRIEAGAGSGSLRGDDGADTLVAGSAMTFLYGGAGADRFVFDAITASTTAAQDQIEDFQTGIDTIDLSGFNSIAATIGTASQNNWISLSAGGTSFSLFVRHALSIGDVIRGATGTAAGETLTGSAGRDVLRGLGGDDVLVGGGGADVLVGGAGTDTFRGTRADLAGDTLRDFTFGERIHVTDAGAGLAVTQVGTRVTLAGGTALTVARGGDLRLDVRAAADGGMEVFAARRIVDQDFDGDGRSDILWRSDAGALTTWSSTGDAWNGATGVLHFVGAEWKIAGTGDFNGDGVSDLLWRNDNGRMTDWFGTGRGFDGATNVDYYAGADWKIAGTGDVTGDGRDDIVWRNDNGALSVWVATDAGFDGASGIAYQVGADWTLAGMADLDGDGRSDIVWRNTAGVVTHWTSTGDGFATAGATLSAGADWRIAGTADFNGDTLEDVLWRNDAGVVTQWLSTGTGFAPASFALAVGAEWQVAATGDYNGDGRADILWRNAGGAVTTWVAAGDSFEGATPVFAAGADWGVFV